jgi:hypothetical protein
VQQRSPTPKAPLIRQLRIATRRLSQRFGWGRVFGLAALAGSLALRAWDSTPLQLIRLKTFDLINSPSRACPASD